MRRVVVQKMELKEKPTRSWQVDFLPQERSFAAAGQRVNLLSRNSKPHTRRTKQSRRCSWLLWDCVCLLGKSLRYVGVEKMELREKPTRSWPVDFLPEA